ncbi:uncharacterized protein BP01DRAFT_3617 [Aspergillus saccharolyticus JOP 1030-1]|uniref:Uncharacterized protein n=1 Tax=Aspergillus saccharolyticus JOP 1030-1 TaxID=1450539 RepID=A0A318ZQB5_9EURO|nr:hypothetical protein BP01DRAFT_3617 [Aspergillus saccharolyticus JOP 1030-1]PYH49696.1 hypothetical protein BP01DRAFT_3617 [Aspergillus saccharolyticus JOP 1030-1]
MSHDRVIQDSDDEDDHFMAPPQQETDNAHTDDYLQGDETRHEGTERNYDPSINIDFDQYLQSQERSLHGHSSPQRPLDSGGGSMGSMMNEIGLAQQRLFDDDEVQMIDPSRQQRPQAVYSESMQTETIPLQAEQSGPSYPSDPSHGVLNINRSSLQAGPPLSFITQPNTSSLNPTPPPQQYEAPLSDTPNQYLTTHPHVEVPIQPYQQQFSSIPEYDDSSSGAVQTSSSFNVFEASLPPLQNVYPNDLTTNHHHHNFPYSATTIPTEVALTSSPRRVASLQATPLSPHDTIPISSVPSAAKASRSKSESHHPHTTPRSDPSANHTTATTSLLPTQLSTDELVTIQIPAAAETPIVEKKRGRKMKQQQQQQQEQQQPPSPLPPTEPNETTNSTVIILDDDNEGAGAPEAGQSTINMLHTTEPQPLSLPATPATEPPNNNSSCSSSSSNTKPEKRKPGRPPKNSRPSTSNPIEELSNLDPPHTATTGLLPATADDPQTKPTTTTTTTTAAPAKEPKKKKLKRGKTTSVTLTKTYDSDIEPDVIWVQEDAGAEAEAEAVLPPDHVSRSSIPNASNAQEHCEPPTKTETAPAPKKRGRKRKNPDPVTSEQGPEQDEQENQEQLNDPVHNQYQPDASEPHLHESAQEEGAEMLPPKQQADPTPDPPPAPPDSAEPDTVPITPLKTTKGPTRHSPISSTSKVPYRVGLSRRARIAPLLKVVKR